MRGSLEKVKLFLLAWTARIAIRALGEIRAILDRGHGHAHHALDDVIRLKEIMEDLGVFGRLNPHGSSFDKKVKVACGDGSHFLDLVLHDFLLAVRRGSKKIIQHFVALNGGALALSESLCTQEDEMFSPIRDDLVVLNHIRKALAIKQVNDVVLSIHWPCGVAELHHLSLLDQIEHLVAAKERLKSLAGQHGFPVDLKVVCEVHFARYDELTGRYVRKTYHVSATKWRAQKDEVVRRFTEANGGVASVVTETVVA